jgi:hypothetical protein
LLASARALFSRPTASDTRTGTRPLSLRFLRARSAR